VHAVYAPGANAEPEPSAAVFHPKNVYPDLVGCVVDIVNVEPLSHVWSAGSPDPPLASYATVTVESALYHCAYNTVVAHDNVPPGAYDEPEPSDAVFHPKNVYPALVGTVDDNVTVDADVHDWSAGSPVPPFALYATTDVSGTHCAYNVRSAHDTVDPPANAVPVPSAAVFHPKNVYPVLVGAVVDNVTFPDVHDWSAGSPDPPFGSYATTDVLGAHWA
jgi:hypothetical protein